jgi:hypothetical protein
MTILLLISTVLVADTAPAAKPDTTRARTAAIASLGVSALDIVVPPSSDQPPTIFRPVDNASGLDEKAMPVARDETSGSARSLG